MTSYRLRSVNDGDVGCVVANVRGDNIFMSGRNFNKNINITAGCHTPDGLLFCLLGYWIRFSWVLVIFCQGVFVGAAFAQLEAYDQRFLDGLRQRGYYDLAASCCRRQLARDKLSPIEQAWWTAELIRTYTEQALASPDPAQQDTAIQKARQEAARYVAAAGDRPVSVWVRRQAALTEMAWGKRLREVLELSRKATDDERGRALSALRQAARQLEEFERWLDQQIPSAPRLTTGQQPTQDDLLAVRSQVRLLRGGVLREQALCYPDGADRLGLLGESLQSLQQALSQLPDGDRLTFLAYVEQAMVLRHLGSFTEAEPLLSKAQADEAPQEIRQLAAAERLRLLVAQGRWHDAWQSLQQPPPGPANAEWDLAVLEVLIALWHQEFRPPVNLRNTWREQAVALTHHIEKQHGPYWARRAEQLLLRAAGAGSGAADAELLRRQADDLFLRGQLGEALEAYDRAAEMAARLNVEQERWTARGRAARLAEKLDDLPGAAERWRTAALERPDRTEASAAHREALRLAAQAVQRGALPPEKLDQWLEEHLQHWPDGGSADGVRLALADRYAQQRRWDEALALCRAIRTLDRQGDAVRLARQIWQTRLTTAPAEELTVLRDELARYFESMAARAEPAVAALAAVARAWLTLGIAPELAPQMAAQLTQLDPSLLVDRDRADYQAALLLAQALQPDAVAASEELLRDISDLEPQVAWDVAARLVPRLDHASQDHRTVLAALVVKLLDRCQPGSGPADAERWVALRVEALLAAGQWQAAAELARKAATDYPMSLDWQLTYARVLGRAATEIGWQPALQQWRRVAAGSAPGSDPWFEAKLGVAEALAASGQPDEARKLLRYVLLTSPPPQGSPWNARYQKLLSRLSQ
ncbi:MAG: hypothetical protein KatS3mg110_1424 [Pirellulaceae bacterium]|nr:MAG: hypothetical protein KatS3mg110_1424 [Pirellulaceae bacterium]